MKNGYILKVKRIAKSNWKTNFNINEFPCHLPILVGIFFFHYQLQEQKKKREKRTAARLFGSQSSDCGNSRLLMSGRREILHERLTCFVCSITKSTEGAKDSEVKQNTSGFVT